MHKPLSIHIKVEDDLLKELRIFDAEREENGTNNTFIEIENIAENNEEYKKDGSADHMTPSNSDSINSNESSDVNANRTKIIKIKSNITEENGRINIVAN